MTAVSFDYFLSNRIYHVLSRTNYKFIGTLLLVLILLLVLYFNDITQTGVFLNLTDAQTSAVIEPVLSQKYIETDKGLVSLKELNDRIYSKLGYRIEEWCDPLPCLAKINALSGKGHCDKVYKDAQEIAARYDPNMTPPRDFSNDIQKSLFTLFDHVKVEYVYSNEKQSASKRTWSKADIDNLLNAKVVSGYGLSGLSIDTAIQHHSIEGQVGMVIGSQTPWVEAICLRNKAKNVITVDYYEDLIIENENIKFLQALQLLRDHQTYYETMDFVVSFSSIEHSGMGRYGDPLDPFGDIKEMVKIRCLLKPGGLLFLGVPVNKDRLVYNLHRIYGRLRLPLMFAGYKLLETYFDQNPLPLTLTKELIEEHGVDYRQYLFVLQKI